MADALAPRYVCGVCLVAVGHDEQRPGTAIGRRMAKAHLDQNGRPCKGSGWGLFRAGLGVPLPVPIQTTTGFGVDQ